MASVDELVRLRPSEGARFLFELDQTLADGRQARYQAWVLTPAEWHAYDAVLADDAAVELRPLATPAPDELAAMLTTIARLTARAAAGKHASGLPPWPNRVLRWRGAGR